MTLTDDTWVSVVMPVYNAGDYLSSAVCSILQQTHRYLELIIVDDHSTDNALESLKRSVSDSRLRIVSSPGCGIIDALNFGVSLAKHETIARMDGDDIASQKRLDEQLTYARRNPDVDFIAAKVTLFKDLGDIGEGYALYQQWINSACEHNEIAKNIFIESPLPHPTVMFQKKTFEALGGYQDHGWPEDYDLWFRAYLAGMKFGKPDTTTPLLNWRDHSHRSSRLNQRYTKQSFLRCKAHYLSHYLQKQLGVKHCSIWGAGPTGLKLHDYLEENGIKVMYFYDINPKLKNKRKRGKSIRVIAPDTQSLVPDSQRSVCLTAVGARGARDLLEEKFKQFGWSQGRNYILAA